MKWKRCRRRSAAAKSGALADLAEVLEREAEVADAPTAQADFLYRLGELKTGSLYDLDGALSAFRKAIERYPQHVRVAARAAVERLINSPAHAVAALDLLSSRWPSRSATLAS